MSLSIIEILLNYAQNSSYDGTYTDSSTGCAAYDDLSSDSEYLFYQLMVIPSVLEFILLSFMITRQTKWLDKCWSRPGILYPMDIYEMKNRISFIAAFGAISFLFYEVILNSRYIFPFTGHLGVRFFVILFSVVCYGFIYFPIFAALTLKSPIGYAIGSLHVWVFTYKAYDDTFGCASKIDSLDQFLVVLRDWPKLLAISYLAIAMPVRFLISVKLFPHIPMINPRENTVGPMKDELEKIRCSFQGRHIRKILDPPVETVEEDKVIDGCRGKMFICCEDLLKPWIYRNNPEFKYSARILSVYFVCFILIYKISAEFLFFLVPLFDYLLLYIAAIMEYIGWYPSIYDTPDIESARTLLYIVYYSVDSMKICFICACVIEVLLSCMIIFHMISSYRKNLIGLYKGSKIHIPPRSEKSNPSIMVGTMRYTGYQVGYILWGYLIQWSIFFLIFNVIALIINLYRIGAADFITNLIKQLWPAPITALALNLIQILLAKFVFLQERGNLLAIDNRRGFFFLTYFVFFYNTFLGVVSCLLRIIKAIVIGALFLGRLDHSTLPRRFQLMDPGFDAYVGFMHMENAHFNPIVLTFLSLLKRKTDSDTKNKKGIENELYDVKYNMKGHPHRLAIRRWQLSCMLHYNPQLRIMRKQYLSNLRPSKAGIVTSKNEVKDKPSVSVTIPGKDVQMKV
ncbi:receptor for retinol uptake stra6-like [Mytilus galloprovincialis]|uniref:receptor for retinol uptake stra6-like n=1 Tax=Mytilus galloprovincialis TaxID=29158 RepID=UPI003F7BA2AD